MVILPEISKKPMKTRFGCCRDLKNYYTAMLSKALLAKKGTTLVVVNSGFGCAAANGHGPAAK